MQVRWQDHGPAGYGRAMPRVQSVGPRKEALSGSRNILRPFYQRFTETRPMSHLARWLIVAAISLPGMAAGQSLGLKLRLDRELRPIPPDEQTDQESTLFIAADELSGTEGDYVDAAGHVRLRTRGRVVFADKLFYSLRDDTLTATGHVRVDRRGDVLEGKSVTVNMRNDSAYAESPEYYFRQLNARGKAEKLFIDSKTHIRALGATYSTCKVPEDDWYLRVGKLDLDRKEDEGVARNVMVFFKNIPLLYTPYIDFPLSNRRKSGLLTPTYGTTGKSGFEFTQPVYLNLAPNFDATIAPRFLAKRGLMLNNEFRYLMPSFRGIASVEYLPNDRDRQGERRYALALRHDEAFSNRLTGYLNLQKASDDLYFVDLSNRLAVTSISNLPREAGFTYAGGWWTLSGRTQKFQTLQDPRAPIVPPYARLPQLTLTALEPDVRGFEAQLYSEFVSFSHPTLLNGRRFTLYPSLSYPLQRSFVTITPKLGLHQTFYDLDRSTLPSNESRTIPTFSLDSTVTFERDTSFLGTPLLQTLEPRLYYVYIPYHDQSRLPVFDTALADFNLAQAFSENQFVGGDRINDANQLTGAVTSRLIDPLDGRERLRLTLGERFFFGEQRVTLPNTPPRTQSRSDLLAAATGRMTGAWYIDSALTYDVNERHQDRSSLSLRYNPVPGKVLNAGYRFNRDSFEQTDLSAQWALNDRWSTVGRWSYSLRDRRSTTVIAGIEYNAGCWVGRFVMQEFVTLTQDSVRAFFVQLELNGLSKIGSNPLDILRQNVAGYQNINALPQTQFNEDYYPLQ
ncbi:MAG: LPS assembly protein LptD [Betaproteobacteria bacterium]|nr:LPS assembly protein LptD [Betaproteobacteria bacterium]